MLSEIAQWTNVLARFCGVRDVPDVTRAAMSYATGGPAGVAILFGGSIIAGCDTLAAAIRGGGAATSVIAGGQGHTTDVFRRSIEREHPSIPTQGRSEAELLDDLLWERHRLRADLLETTSRNSGENARNVLSVLERHGLPAQSLLLIHDATMQRRMAAVFRAALGEAATLTSYAGYQARVAVRDAELVFAESSPGMWSVETFTSMLLGEIVRLTDDEAGYGPRGRGYIAHVDVPEDVLAAAERLAACGITPRATDMLPYAPHQISASNPPPPEPTP